jgi:hypothetical protein
VEDIGKRDQDLLIALPKKRTARIYNRAVSLFMSIFANRELERTTMARELTYGTVLDRPRKVIHVVRLLDGTLDAEEIDEIAAKMRERMLSKHGEQAADVVVVQGSSKETLRLSGDSYAISRVRAAMFNAAISWRPIELE